MPGSAASESQVKSCAWLRIFGSSLNFGQISATLGVEPSEIHNAGQPMPSGQPIPKDMWSLRSGLPRISPMDSHLRWLDETLRPHFEFLRALKGMAEVRSFCGVIAEGEECTFTLSAEALTLFVELDIDLELSLIFLGLAHEQPAAQGSPAWGSDSEVYRTESRVVLDIGGNDLDLAGITRAFGLQPSEVHRSHDLDVSGKPYSTDVWSFVAPLSATEDLDAHLRWLGSALLRHPDSVRSVTRGADALIRCDFGTESDNGGVGISPHGLKVLVEFKIPMDFHAYLI